MKILTRHQSTDEIAEHVKSRIAKLRSVCKVIQTGLIAMDVHVEGEMVGSTRRQVAKLVQLNLTSYLF